MSPRMIRYLDRHIGPVRCGLRVLEVGAADVNGSIRSYFKHAVYRGLDLEPGPGVDFVVRDETFQLRERFDWVVSVNTFEHVRYPWILIRSIADALDSGGRALIVAPFSFQLHRVPIDCWRFAPDGFKALACAGRLTLETSYLDYEASALYGTFSDLVWLSRRSRWRECIEVARGYLTRPPAWNCVAVMRKENDK
jgi:SAM-dependent methyltransferase